MTSSQPLTSSSPPMSVSLSWNVVTKAAADRRWWEDLAYYCRRQILVPMWRPEDLLRHFRRRKWRNPTWVKSVEQILLWSYRRAAEQTADLKNNMFQYILNKSCDTAPLNVIAREKRNCNFLLFSYHNILCTYSILYSVYVFGKKYSFDSINVPVPCIYMNCWEESEAKT